MNSNKTTPSKSQQKSVKIQDDTPQQNNIRDREINALLEKASDHFKQEDMFVDYVEREIDEGPSGDDTSNSQYKQQQQRINNSMLPPRSGETFAQKQKKQLREGVKHMTKVTLSNSNGNLQDQKQMNMNMNMNVNGTTKLMQSLLREDQIEKARKLEKYKQMEDDLVKKDDLNKAEKMLVEEKKWYKEVVQRIDIVPEDINYYEKLAIKPGFDFIYALINCDISSLETLRINIPEILYFNFSTYLVYSDVHQRVHIKQTPKSKDFLDLIESKANYDIVRNWNEPATVLRKATSHPCYQTINLFNWKQSYEYIRNGPANRTMIQRYQKSFGEKLTLYRAVVHPEEMVNTKGSGKYNFCYALNNKVAFKSSIDEQQRIIDEFQKLRKQEQDMGGYIDEDGQRSSRKLNNKFENRYLICPFEVGSFDVYTYTGKTMSIIEKEAYKIFNFMEKAFDMRLLNCVTDWIRDERGQHWFIGLKSYKLRELNYDYKTTKPTAFERELLAINQNKKVKKKDFLFCEVCYNFILRDIEQYDEQQNLAYLEYIPNQNISTTNYTKQNSKLQAKKTKPQNIRNIQRFRPKMFQWRIIVIAHKIIDVNPKLLESKGHPVYLQYKFGESITKFQLSAQGQPIKYVFEKVKSETAYSRNVPNIIAETEAIFDENNEEIEVLNSQREMVRVVKANKSRVSYFYTYQKNDLTNFFNSCEIEFRITLGQNWNNYVSCCKGNLLNYFSNVIFKRGTESHYTRNLMLFTEDLQGVNLRLTMGLSLDNECDMSQLSEQELISYLGQVYLPPENYYPNSIVLNPLPQQWMKLIRNEQGQVFNNKPETTNKKKKLYHPDGRPYTKMDYYRLQQYGSISNKLLSTTVANRAAGLQDQTQNTSISLSRIESGKRNQSEGGTSANRPKISIPDQIKAIQEKKKLKKRAFVMPSQKAAFYKKQKLAQNVKIKLDTSKKDIDSENERSQDNKDQVESTSQKIKFKDIFKEEGMYHSVSETTMRRSFTLLKSATRDLEKKYTEEEMQLLDYEERYNQGLFDQGAIKKIEIKNLRALNPYNKEVVKVEKQQKMEEEQKRLQLEELKISAGLPPPGVKRGKTQAMQKVFTREIKKSKKEVEEENRKKQEEENKIRKEQEDKKFAELKTKLTHKFLRNVRSVNYANYSTL